MPPEMFFCVHARPRACVYVCALVCVCVYAHLRAALCESVRVRRCLHLYVLGFQTIAILAREGQVT